MLVVTRNGRTTVLTGWRAWLAGTVIFVIAAMLVAFMLLGIAVTVGAVLLILVPVAIGVALVASAFRTHARR